VQAQTILSGTIKDTKGEPMIGATVALKGSKIGTTTNVEGKYSLKLDNAPSARISLSAVGYKTITENIMLNGNEQQQDFVLSEDVFNFEQVVVTGTSTTRTQREMAGSLTQLSSKQIQATSPNSMADILRFIPGVHVEGGGGDVASNIFVRGLPSGGQYKYNPIEEDGMPVQSTGYLTSSAQDVYFRPDLGIANMEFARGGSSTLFGMGAPLGVFNYISKKGGGVGETEVKLSGGQYNLYRVDFNTGGSISDKWQYNLSGFARYDEGPLVTGSPSRGYQIRGNITRQIENGYFRIYFRTLDDNSQFFLPFPHVKNSIDAALGNNGKEITTLNTPYGGNFSLVNPLGTITGSLGNGVTAKGNSFMFEFAKSFNGWDFQSKTRLSKFEHRFDFWSPGKTFEIDAYAKSKNPTQKSYTYTYADNGLPLTLSTGANNGKTYVTEESITLRNRPMSDYSTDLRLTKKIVKGTSEHNITIGAFGAVTRQLQDEVGTGVLVELNDQPRLVDLALVDANGQTIKVTKAGFRQNIAGRTYNTFEADKVAFYAGDEMVFNKLRVDAGLRYEAQQGVITVGESAAYANPSATTSADASYRWLTGKTNFRKISFNDYSFVLGTNYSLNKTTNLYGSFTKGFYFPELRTFSNISRDKNGNFIQAVPTQNESVYQLEGGAKYASDRLSGSIALYYNTIKNRLQNDIISGSDGVLREITNAVGSTTTYGTEISVAYRLSAGLIIDANTTLQNHRYDEFFKTLPGADGTFGTADDSKVDYKGNWILRQPKFMLNAGLSYDKKNWDLGLMYNYEGKRYADDQNNIEMPAYSLVNMRAARSFEVGTKQTIKIGLNLYNAFNNRGLTEGDPRVADTSTITNDPFYNARPILPRRLTASITFKF
jgi:outer membrane receptor protein involved in Fe transport